MILRHLLAVNRHYQRLADANVVERRNLGVEGINSRTRPRVGMHLQLGIFLRLLNVVGIRFIVPDDISLTRLQAGEPRLRIRQGFETGDR